MSAGVCVYVCVCVWVIYVYHTHTLQVGENEFWLLTHSEVWIRVCA
jgi:hypothetical protein